MLQQVYDRESEDGGGGAAKLLLTRRYLGWSHTKVKWRGEDTGEEGGGGGGAMCDGFKDPGEEEGKRWITRCCSGG